MTATRTLDVRGRSCPLPIIDTAKAIKDLKPGETLEVLATDPGAKTDFPAWSSTTGNPLLEQSEEDGVFRFVVRKA